jgi:hypothetical protein
VPSEKVWFIWLNLGITKSGAGFEVAVSAPLPETGMVAQTQIPGRPFKRAFGRRELP